MNPDPVAALREVLAKVARIPALEAEIEYLRKHNASADLEGKIKAGRPEPGLAEVRFLPTPADLTADLDDADWGWLWITRVDAMRLFRALTKARGSKIDKTPTITSDTVHCAAIRLAALVEMAEEKDRRIAELEEELRTINAALDRFHADVGIEPGTMQIGQVLDHAATHYLEREHLTSEVRVLEDALANQHQEAHGVLDELGAPRDVPLAERIKRLQDQHLDRLVQAPMLVKMARDASARTSGHLPCPFCGSKAVVHSAIDTSIAPKVERWNAVALCRSCGATGPSAVGTTHTEGIANAWAAWDRRGGAR